MKHHGPHQHGRSGRVDGGAIALLLIVLAGLSSCSASGSSESVTATPTNGLSLLTLYLGGSHGICTYRTLDGQPKTCFGNLTTVGAFAVASGILYANSGRTVVAGSPSSGTIRWTYALPDGQSGIARPQVVGNAVFVGSGSDSNAQRTGDVCALNTTDGTVLWCHQTGDTVSAIAADADSLYVSTAENADNLGHGDPYVYALDAATGTLRWRFRTTLGPLPTVAGNTVFITSGFPATGQVPGEDHMVYALDRLTGKLKWEKPTGAIRLDSLIANGSNSSLFASATDGNLYALDPGSGSTRWHFAPPKGMGLTDAFVFGDTMYAGAWGPKPDEPDQATSTLYALRIDTGAINWQQSFDGTVGGIVGASGAIFALADLKSLQAVGTPGVGVLHCFDAITGAVRWTTSTDQGYPGELVAAA